MEGQDLAKAVNNLNKSYKRMINRYNKRLELMLKENYIYFITFTLKDSYLGLKQATIERKIKEALLGASWWIVNMDFGSRFGRLHYHGLATYNDKLDYKSLLSIYKYGSIDIIPVKDKNQKALREYILGHSLKQTARRVMMSRKRC